MNPDEYPCPECGYEGPHVVQEIGRDEDVTVSVVECGSCYAEFEVTST